jgi:hypothetical protein
MILTMEFEAPITSILRHPENEGSRKTSRLTTWRDQRFVHSFNWHATL